MVGFSQEMILRQRFELNMGYYSLNQINNHFSKFKTNFGNFKKEKILSQLIKINGYLKTKKDNYNKPMTPENILSNYLIAQSLYLFHEIIHLDLTENETGRINFKKIVNKKPYKVKEPFRTYFRAVGEDTLIEYIDETFLAVEETKIFYEPKINNSNSFSSKLNNRISDLSNLLINENKYTTTKHLEFEALIYSLSKVFAIKLVDSDKIKETAEHLKKTKGFFYLPIPSCLNETNL